MDPYSNRKKIVQKKGPSLLSILKSDSKNINKLSQLSRKKIN